MTPAALSRVPTVLANWRHGRQRLFVGRGRPKSRAVNLATDTPAARGIGELAISTEEPAGRVEGPLAQRNRTALATVRSADGARTSARRRLEPGPGSSRRFADARTQPPTAIFCANDPTAIGAIEALKQLGLRVPRRLRAGLRRPGNRVEIRTRRYPPSCRRTTNWDVGPSKKLFGEEYNRAAGAPVRHAPVKLDGPLVERASVRVITEAKIP